MDFSAGSKQGESPEFITVDTGECKFRGASEAPWDLDMVSSVQQISPVNILWLFSLFSLKLMYFWLIFVEITDDHKTNSDTECCNNFTRK